MANHDSPEVLAGSDAGGGRGPTGAKNRGAHVIEGRIAEIGDGYVLLGFSSAPIRLTDQLADGFQPGQRVTITVLLVDGEFIAQKIELAPR